MPRSSFVFFYHYYVPTELKEITSWKDRIFCNSIHFPAFGEYVIEILIVLNNHINEYTMPNYLRFIRENTRYWQQTQSRVVSYWDAYGKYPSFGRFGNIGKQVINHLKDAGALG